MQDARKMTGVLRVCPAAAPDGSKQVLTVLPNGAQFSLSAADAMTYAFAVLTVARDLFPSKEALDSAVPTAYDRVDEMLVRGRKDLQ
jgi:hypothetical protein